MRTLGRSWRIAIAVIADVVFVLAIAGLRVERADGYFRIRADTLTLAHVLAGLVVLYLGLVAISGRWWFKRRG